jgi:hypothetical protein
MSIEKSQTGRKSGWEIQTTLDAYRRQRPQENQPVFYNGAIPFRLQSPTTASFCTRQNIVTCKQIDPLLTCKNSHLACGVTPAGRSG